MSPPYQSPREFLRQYRFGVATALVIAVLAGINWIQDPTQALRWLGAMLMLPGSLVLMSLWAARMRRTRPPATAEDEQSGQRYFRAAVALLVIGIGLLQITKLGLNIWVRIGDHGADLDFERRILGLAAAAVVLIYGNTLPKILTPLSILPLHLAERVTSARRFVGTIWFLLGVVMATGFIAMPLPLARTLAVWSFIAGMLTVVGAIVWMNLGPARKEQ